MKKFIFNKGVKALGLICCSAMLAVNTSCENFLEEKEVPRLTNDYYNSEQGVEAGIASVYSYMREFVGGETINELTEYGNDLIPVCLLPQEHVGICGTIVTRLSVWQTRYWQLCPE